MVRSKAPAKKQQIDFKKIKRKLGRKLPPPKNATNTEIKSKAIIIPEQSVAAEKTGFATSNKNLTLEELLVRSRHPNAKVRKNALLGIQDLLKSHPVELQSKKYTIIQCLKGRVNDDDKQVRKAFYELFETQIFRVCKQEDIKGLMVSPLMLSIFHAMANSLIDVRLDAFAFLHLVVDYYPPSFSMYPEEILENYKDIIIQSNHFYVQDKTNLKVALSGLSHCLSLLPYDEIHTKSQKKHFQQIETLLAYEQDAAKEGFAHVSVRLKEIVGALINCFQDFIQLLCAPRGLDPQSLIDCVHHILCSICCAIKFSHTQTHTATEEEEVTLMKLDHHISSMLSKKLLASFPLIPKIYLSKRNDESYFILNGVLTEIFLEVSEWSHLPCDLSYRFLEFIENTLLGKIIRSISPPIHEKALLLLVPFVPKLTLRVDRDWRDKLMQAFTITLSDCKPESPLQLACISIVRELIIPNGNILYPNDPTVDNYQLAWVNKLPSLLHQLGDKNPVSTQVVLQLLLDLGRVGFLKNTSPAFEEDVRNFFNPYQGEGDVPGGPFASLPREAQELALSFLYYFTIDHFSSPMLKAIVSCCLYEQLKPAVLYRIVEILHTAYRDGYIQITDHFSFFITLIARFKVVPPEMGIECDERRETTFKALTNLVCSCLSGMGDSSLVLQILEKAFVEQIILKPALDNGCGILRMICTLDSKPTRLSESSVTTLSEFLPGYLMDIVNCIPEDKEKSSYLYIQTCLYYLVPCFLLFDRSSKLTEEVLKRLRLMVSEYTKAMLESPVWESSRNLLNLIQCIVSVILLMHNDVRVRKIISSFKSEIDLILHSVVTLQSSSMTVEGKHMMKIAGERLRIASNSLVSCTTVTIE
ncbi:uncharacterized protein LOC9315060 isoform X2 [Arabidopsis lyrata subsp. lyrata]|uniref:uncharacterized protein LOC9315060 isoform X2 n=1 Tax=Arabidopsis lyrata subsp. lyrata TaxID=81972 RepID=UPI000A29E4E1|nr:uncharacterized protein LOC9315060 isoform X2 [Arabidopsis lyrata subsp. lyrata]|eukprot:XP_020884472.1 uncharacterized protein LOC9315060 isoform X2 [Arabidopsis lyrata subsp. lyrata]